MSEPYITEFPSLYMQCLTAELREHTAGYWYTITSAATATTAFRSREELMEWADDLGLEFASTVPDPNPENAVGIAIGGLYRRASHMDVATWQALSDVVLYRPEIDNAEHTVGAVTVDPDGHRTVHLINVNSRQGVFPFDRHAPRQTVADYIAATYH